MKNATPRVPTTIRLPLDLKQQVRERAATLRQSAESFIEQAVRAELRRSALNKLALPQDWTPALAQRLLECAPTPIVIKDSEARIVWCNFAYEDLVGVGREAMLNQRISELNVLDRASAERVEKDIRLMQEELTTTTEPIEFWEPLTIVKREGRTSIFRAYRFFFRRKSRPGIFIGDISFDWGEIRLGYPSPPRRDLEERLSTSPVTDGVWELFEPFLEHCPVAVAVKDLETRLVWCNADYERVVGRTRAEAKGLPTTALLNVTDVDRIVQNEHDALKNNRSMYAIDVVNNGKPRTSLRFPILGGPDEVNFMGVVSAEFRQQDIGSRTPVPIVPPKKAVRRPAGKQRAETLAETGAR
jgi:PAS domain-containing protein